MFRSQNLALRLDSTQSRARDRELVAPMPRPTVLMESAAEAAPEKSEDSTWQKVLSSVFSDTVVP